MILSAVLTWSGISWRCSSVVCMSISLVLDKSGCELHRSIFPGLVSMAVVLLSGICVVLCASSVRSVNEPPVCVSLSMSRWKSFSGGWSDPESDTSNNPTLPADKEEPTSGLGLQCAPLAAASRISFAIRIESKRLLSVPGTCSVKLNSPINPNGGACVISCSPGLWTGVAGWTVGWTVGCGDGTAVTSVWQLMLFLTVSRASWIRSEACPLSDVCAGSLCPGSKTASLFSANCELESMLLRIFSKDSDVCTALFIAKVCAAGAVQLRWRSVVNCSSRDFFTSWPEAVGESLSSWSSITFPKETDFLDGVDGWLGASSLTRTSVDVCVSASHWSLAKGIISCRRRLDLESASISPPPNTWPGDAASRMASSSIWCSEVDTCRLSLRGAFSGGISNEAARSLYIVMLLGVSSVQDGSEVGLRIVCSCCSRWSSSSTIRSKLWEWLKNT